MVAVIVARRARWWGRLVSEIVAGVDGVDSSSFFFFFFFFFFLNCSVEVAVLACNHDL
jgi:hypothetical protein